MRPFALFSTGDYFKRHCFSIIPLHEMPTGHIVWKALIASLERGGVLAPPETAVYERLSRPIGCLV